VDQDAPIYILKRDLLTIPIASSLLFSTLKNTFLILDIVIILDYAVSKKVYSNRTMIMRFIYILYVVPIHFTFRNCIYFVYYLTLETVSNRQFISLYNCRDGQFRINIIITYNYLKLNTIFLYK